MGNRSSRRLRALRLAAVLFGACGVLLGNAIAAAESKRVSGVLLITVDSLRADHVGAYGGPVATPSIDALAADGAVVESAFTSIPAVGPSHASLMTGRYPWNHHTQRNGVPLDARLPVLAEGFRAAGFATAAFVSNQNLHRRYGFHKGFDVYHFEPTEDFVWRGRRRPEFFARADATVSAAMSWLTAVGDAPFFLWLQLSEPHLPYEPPSEYRVPPDSPVDRAGKTLPSGIASFERLDALNRDYRGEVATVDAQIGRIVQRLRLLGMFDRSAVIVTAGSGEGLGEHGELGHRANLFDETVRVPLVIRAAGIPAGRRLSGLAQSEDLAVTIRALVAAEPLAARDGVDLLPWLVGAIERSPRNVVVGQRRASNSSEILYFEVSGPRKWIGRADGAGVVYARDSDPGELTPLAANGMPDELRRSLAAAGVARPPND